MCKSHPKNMVIFVFVVDTSASMNQRTSVGTTLLDVAKNAVETFTKLRQRDQASRTDRYMLVTLEEPPGAIKAGWRENQATFMNELKNLQATGLSTLGTSLKEAFDLLNLYRLHSGIDNYGMGRNPFYVEPALVVCITDGSKLSSQNGVHEELHLPMHTTLPGHELTTEPFRWDQRLFSIILRMPGTRSSLPNKMGMHNGDPAIAAMCEVTGGRCYKVSSSKSLGQALESLAQKVQCGVVLNFEKIGGATNPPPPAPEGNLLISKKLTYDSTWIKTYCMSIINWRAGALMVAKEEQALSSVAWKLPPQTFIVNSSKKLGDIGFPFGYLKASSNLQTVNLFVMPYNFPVLFPIVDELVKVHKMKPTLAWKEKFDNYLSTMPNYYAGPLRNAFRRMGIPSAFVPDHLDSFLSYTVVNYLKKVKQQSKMETERLISLVGKNATRDAVPRPLLSVRTPQLPKAKKQDFRALLHSNFSVNSEDSRVSSETDFNIPNTSFHNVKQVRNLYNITAKKFCNIDTHYLFSIFHVDARHSVAIADMGNYQEVLRQLSPLREVDPGQNRVHMFGNPFKLAKDQRVLVDEADVNEAMAGVPSRKRPGSPRDKKRQQETPPVRWPNKVNQNGGNSLPVPQNNKLPPDKNALLQDGKTNNIFSGHGIKRKHSEGSEGVNKVLKSSKSLIKPQLAKLQQRLHNKGKINWKQQPVAKTDSINSSKNDFVSSILKEAVTSQSRTCQGVPVENSHDSSTSKNVLTNSESQESFADCLSKEQGGGLSPRALKKQLIQEAYEENRLIRNLVFRDIRQPEKSDDVILDRVANLKGSFEIQSSTLQEIIEEAELFKKKALIERLSSHLAILQQRLSPESFDAKHGIKKR
ncbi:PREDICTED: integrator complex subunit 6-like [Acropora digitifera]|uniref:integrator complex subunit 6-like n=1 Tax=Acropora digitifera TaxID=70779 RepID=UPI00077A76E6|nr:PREDICTED: integrator complex subunit 6-like [Acropora digitifera]